MTPEWAAVAVAASLGYGGVILAVVRMIVRNEIASMLDALDRKFVHAETCHERHNSCKASAEHRLSRIERWANGRLRSDEA